jgi:phosphatidyl-myo-inositol dimannoside synthase
MRSRSKVLLPTAGLRREIEALAEEVVADLVMIDPPLPTGLITPGLNRRHGTFVHGGVATQARPPAAKQLLRRAMAASELVVSAGEFSAGEVREVMGERTPPIHVVNPGVDVTRFGVLDYDRKRRVRRRLGLPVDAALVLSVSRLVPRKGMPTLVEAVASLAPERSDLFLAIGGTGRDHNRTKQAIERTGAPARLLGQVGESDLADLYGCADVFAMACHDRWAGLEQEGFGIVFAEAAACGVPSVAGRSGGSAEAVLDGETGFVVQEPTDPVEVAACLAPLLDDPDLRRRQGEAARRRAENELSWDVSAVRLEEALESVGA